MNKRQKLKKKKREYVTFAYKIDIASEMKEDSIAHLIKAYFTLDTIRCKELFKWDENKKKLLVSKKCLNHLLKICESEPLERNLDMELVEDIKILKEE